MEHRYAAVEQAAVQALTLRGEATTDQLAIDVPDLPRRPEVVDRLDPHRHPQSPGRHRAQAVELDEGTGYLLAEDLDATDAATGPTAALLPGLDPTPMGWRHRYWYLDPDHAKAPFDRNGNIGPTIWWNGRIIGAWAQRTVGHINHRLPTGLATETTWLTSGQENEQYANRWDTGPGSLLVR